MIFCFLVIVGVLPKRRARALRTPTTPRPASASASAMTPTVRLSLNYCSIIARPHDDARSLETLAAEMPRGAHFDSESLGFVRARNHTAVVVRQHHNRLPA